MDNSYTGKDTLEFLKDAVNYNRYLEQELLRFLVPYDHAVDFGAGNGEFAARLQAQGKQITTVEADPQLRAALASQGFSVCAEMEAVPMHHRIYSQNVLEHIEDDEATLRAMKNKLYEAGKLFLYVPAFPCLYSAFDSAVGHCRRYKKQELAYKLQRAGFVIERAEYVDSLGFLCWLVMGKLPCNKTHINPAMIKCFDRLIFPVSRLLDKITKSYFGKNLLVIARKNKEPRRKQRGIK